VKPELRWCLRIEGRHYSGLSRLWSEVSENPNETNENPEDFHEERRKIEVSEERYDDQSSPKRIENLINESAVQLVELQ